LEIIKLDPATSSIPIIVCSAAVDDLRSHEPWLMHHGIVTLAKPFDIDDLYKRVESALG
jgi:response regulator RpfG family c-di-GMP phosphodiesterase